MQQRRVYCSRQTRGKRRLYSRKPWLQAKKRGRGEGNRIPTGQRSKLRYRAPERRNQCLGRVSVRAKLHELGGVVETYTLPFYID